VVAHIVNMTCVENTWRKTQSLEAASDREKLKENN